MQEEQIPHRQNLTHCCVLIAMFGVPFFTDFLIICCLQVHLVNFGRWCGLVGSLLALVSNFWEISWCAGSQSPQSLQGVWKNPSGADAF